MEEIEQRTIRKEQDEQAEGRIKERKKNRMNRKKATKKKGNKGRTKEEISIQGKNHYCL